MSMLSNIDQRVMPVLALDGVDSRWASTMSSSLFGRLWQSIRTSLSGASQAGLGTLLQQAGFVVACLLFLILPLPRFVEDKLELAVVVAGAWGLRFLGTLFGGKEQYRASAIDGIVLLFFATNLIASFSSHYLKESLWGLGKYLVYLIAYFLFVWSLENNTNKRACTIVGALLAAGVAVSLYGLIQYKTGVAPLATWEDPSIQDQATRIYSTLKNPNLLAGYLIPLIPLSFGMGMVSFFCKGWRKFLSIGFFGAFLITSIATLLTGSRGAQIAMAFELLALVWVAASWFWRQYPKARWGAVVVAVLLPLAAVAVVHFALPQYETRFKSIFAGSEHSSNAYRLNVYRASLNMFKDNWWLGIGSGNKTFVLAYGLYMKSGFDALGTYSVPLEIAVETGIPGLLAFGWLLLALAARAHRRFWSGTDLTHRWLALTAFVAIIGMMGHGLVDTVFYRPQVEFIFWLCVALITALPAKSNADETA